MSSSRLWLLVAALAVAARGQEGSFTIVKRHPENSGPDKIPVHVVKEGESLTLSCTSSVKFQSCSWVHPSAKACGILSGDDSKRCAKTGSMSSWSVQRDC